MALHILRKALKHTIINKSMNKNLLAIILLSTGLIACSSTDDEEEEGIVIAELVSIDNQFTPKVLWEESVGSGVDDYFSRIKPTIAYGKVFSASREGEVVAFDAITGKQQWQIDLRNVDEEASFFSAKKSALLSGGPIAGINKVFIGSEHGDVFALAEDTGDITWKTKIKGEVIAAPALDDGMLVVNTASGILKAFNASSGDEEWQIEQNVPPLSLRGISSPVIASGGVVVGNANGSINVYILAQGQEGWTAEIGEPTGSTEFERVIDVDSTPVIFGDKIYTISARGNLAAVDLRTGRILWKRQYSSHRQLSISGNTIFLTDVNGHVYAIDRIEGLERWSNLALTNRGVTGPAVVGDYIVVGDFEGYLHWMSQETGEIVARVEADSSGIYSTPTVAKDILYVQSRDGDLQAIKTQ